MLLNYSSVPLYKQPIERLINLIIIAMVELVRNPDGVITSRFRGVATLDELVGTELRTKLVPLIKSHTPILMDLEGVKHIKGKGYNNLSDLFTMSVNHNSIMNFTNIDDNVYEIIESFIYTEEG